MTPEQRMRAELKKIADVQPRLMRDGEVAGVVWKGDDEVKRTIAERVLAVGDRCQKCKTLGDCDCPCP